MLSSSVARLTRQLTQQLSVTTAGRVTTSTTAAAAAASPHLWTILPSQRSFATNRKVIDAKNVKRLKIQAKKKKNVNQPAAASSTAEDDDDASAVAKEKEEANNQPFLQHQEWVKFQQTISVDGFQTGQVTSAQVLKKSRGGKQARRKREKEMARLQDGQSLNNNSTNNTLEKFPAIRYSPEETQELLERAYAALPERAGKRGTRNLQRQKNRWKIVRQTRSKYKKELIVAHERRMEKRHVKRERVKSVHEGAPLFREKDLNYQGQVLRRWAETMMFHDNTAATGAAVAGLVEDEGTNSQGGEKVSAKE